MEPEDHPLGVPIGVDLIILPEEKAIVLQVKLSETPKEGDTVSLAMPADSALQLALALISSVKELREDPDDVSILFPPLDPKKGN